MTPKRRPAERGMRSWRDIRVATSKVERQARARTLSKQLLQ